MEKQQEQRQLTTISHYSSSSLSSPISNGNNNNIVSNVPLSRTSSYQSNQSSNSNSLSNARGGERVCFGNKVFAPPPPFPASLQVIKSKLYHQLANKAVVKSTLPPYHEIKHSGHALARFSIKSRLTKKWRPTFWITQGRHKLLFFRSKGDFDEWAANPYLTYQERIQLVKLTIDLINDVYKAGNNSLKGYRASPIQSKFVKIQQKQQQNRDDTRKMASHFTLEKWTSSKVPSILVEIGGTDPGQVGALHIILVEMIKSSGNEYIPPSTTTTITTKTTLDRLRRGDVSDANSISGNSASVWELRSVGSNSVIGYSFSNLSCSSSIPASHEDGGGPPPADVSDFEFDRRDDDDDDDYGNDRRYEEPRAELQQSPEEWRSNRQSSSSFSPLSSPRLQNLGSRIMMRMRSRSPSTRARRLKELQDEEGETVFGRGKEGRQELVEPQYHHTMNQQHLQHKKQQQQQQQEKEEVSLMRKKKHSNLPLSHLSPRRRESYSTSSTKSSRNMFSTSSSSPNNNDSSEPLQPFHYHHQQQQQDARRPPTPLRNRPPLSPYNATVAGASTSSITNTSTNFGGRDGGGINLIE